MRDILILGHSHVRNLRKFVDQERLRDSRVVSNFGYADVSIHFLAKGGKTVRSSLQQDSREIERLRPNAIIVMLGDNDISEDSSGEEIGALLVTFASKLHSLAPRATIMLTSVLPRFEPKVLNQRGRKAVAAEQYNGIAHASNLFMSDPTNRPDYCLFWWHSKFATKDAASGDITQMPRYRKRIVRRDGVHLTPVGNFDLYKSLIGAIGHVLC